MASFGRNIVFHNIRLTNEQKPDFINFVGEADEPLVKMLAQLGMDGYKFSVTFDPERDCYILAITGTDLAVVNKNSCFTSRSADFTEACMMGLYKHYVLAEGGDWSKIVTQTDDWG